VDRVATLAVKPKATQKELQAAIAPVASRLLIQFSEAKKAFAQADEGSAEAKAGKDQMDALTLFKRDMGTYLRFYSFLGQMFDYANTDYEKRFIFYRLLLPLLEFGREREGIDLSALLLTHHRLRDLGKQSLLLQKQPESPLSYRLQAEQPGTGEVRDQAYSQLQEIIDRLNDLFEGDLSEGDQLIYVNGVIKGKLLESKILKEQAMSNSKEQFANSPDFDSEFMNALMDALAAHQSMSQQALNSQKVRDGLKDILLGPAGLWEALRNGVTAQASP
jgi:type I restriction enzyme R subunit